MIVVKLWGGLGNQMFQYAAARRLALLNGVPLKLDTAWFGKSPPGDTPRRYELAPFNIVAEIATAAETLRIKGVDLRRWPKLLKRTLAWVGYTGPGSYFVERSSAFDPSLGGSGPDLYLDGYWQCERYFNDIAETIRRELSLAEEATGENARLLREIEGCEAVAVHFRRGDYVSNPAAAAFHGTLPYQYYAEALNFMRQRLSCPRFFAFSDDVAWVRQNIPSEYEFTCVDLNGPDQGGEDLRLMSACRHHIIANSSFGWWGAWLGERKDTVVVAPRRWFADPDRDSSYLVPERWIRL